MNPKKMSLTNLIKSLIRRESPEVLDQSQPMSHRQPEPPQVSEKHSGLMKRWETLAAAAKSLDLGSRSVRSLARATKLSWYRSRGDETIDEFLTLSGQEILQYPSFGSGKVNRLCDIIEGILDPAVQAEWPDKKETLTQTNPRETLADWAVPATFPCPLIQLPVRVQNHCEKMRLNTVLELLDYWDQVGASGLIDQPNLGRKSVGVLEDFMDALTSKNREKGAIFLPLHNDPKWAGLSLSSGLSFAVNELKIEERSLLERRLIDNFTLEECAYGQGITRERVRQVERNFLGCMSKHLEFFTLDHEQMISDWLLDRDFFLPFTEGIAVDFRELVKQGLITIFEKSPQGIAHELARENLLETTFTQLIDHQDFWFGGVILEEFLTEYLNPPEQVIFCEFLMTSGQVKIEHQHGLVKPARTNLGAVTKGLLNTEDSPIPLTWLLHLIRETGYHPDLHRNELSKRRASWLKTPSFPFEKVLWDQ